MPLLRHPANPVLSSEDIPYPSSLVFNAGVCKPTKGAYTGKYVMIFRNDYGPRDGADFRARQAAGKPGFDGTNLGMAVSDDGIHFEAMPQPVWQWRGDHDGRANEISRVYDPRLTVIDGTVYVCFAVDSRHGVRGGIAVTEDFATFDILSLSAPDNRNMVLFPERIGGRLARFERPMPIYGRGAPEAFDFWYADSPDGRDWGNHRLVLGAEEVPFANCKIGPGAPPIKTDSGWLATMHYVYKDTATPLLGWERGPWAKTYGIGLILTDLDEPWRIVGMAPEPVLAPEAAYELDGFRGSVLFPGGMLLEDDGEVKIYYGGADTVECLATAHVDDLLALIQPWSPS